MIQKWRRLFWLMSFISCTFMTMPASTAGIQEVLTRFDDISGVLYKIQVQNSISPKPRESDFKLHRQYIHATLLKLSLRMEIYFQMLGVNKNTLNMIEYEIMNPSWVDLEQEIHQFIDKLDQLNTDDHAQNTKKTNTKQPIIDDENINRRVMNALTRLEKRLEKIGLPEFSPALVISRAAMLKETAIRLCQVKKCDINGYKNTLTSKKLILPIDVLNLSLQITPTFNQAIAQIPQLKEFSFQEPPLDATLVTPEVVFNYLNIILGDAIVTLHQLGLNQPLTYKMDLNIRPTDVYQTLDETLFILQQVAKTKKVS